MGKIKTCYSEGAMNENKKSGIGVWVSGLFGFLAGLFIGLVVLGWGLWPVQWANGTMEILAPEVQEDTLRAAIDSNAYRPDDELARQRYQSLGESGAYVLSQIAAAPEPQSVTDIDAFAAAVGATAAIKNPPPAPPAPVTPELLVGRSISAPLMAGLCVAVLLILLVLLILFLQRRSRKKAADVKAPEAPAELAPAETETVSADTAPVGVVAAAAVSSTAEELPDWVQEAAPESLEEQPSAEFDLLGGEAEQSLSDEDIAAITSSQIGKAEEEEMLPDFLKAVPIAAAGAVAVGALHGEEEETQEIEPVEELAAAEEFPVEGGALVAAAAVEEAVQAEAEVETALPELALETELEETQAEAHAKYSQDIQTVSGIGPVYGEKLRAANVLNPLLLLRNGATTKGRQQIAEDTGISEKLILKWVNYVDLYRIKGVSEAYAELLEAAGVDTVPELANRNPQNLHVKLLEVIEEKRSFREPPTLAMVESWVAQAKKLPRAIHY
jgi:predicted flap endonuclease-1-like 5' DNA nuclease